MALLDPENVIYEAFGQTYLKPEMIYNMAVVNLMLGNVDLAL